MSSFNVPELICVLFDLIDKVIRLFKVHGPRMCGQSSQLASSPTNLHFFFFKTMTPASSKCGY